MIFLCLEALTLKKNIKLTNLLSRIKTNCEMIIIIIIAIIIITIVIIIIIIIINIIITNSICEMRDFGLNREIIENS